jgi:flavorubredoxin
MEEKDMQTTKKIAEDLIWVGVNDRESIRFENIFPIPRGVSYNSYVLLDEKTVLFDTVDEIKTFPFLENLENALGKRDLDYLVVHHMEPDHGSNIALILKKYPNVKVVTSVQSVKMISQFFGLDVTDRSIVIRDGDVLETGKHKFQFIAAPMVHWPEVMVSYDVTTGILFSADAFGTFGDMDGAIFADELDFENDWLYDARRYYSNIVGKYGVQVQKLLKQAAELDIKRICSLHGPIWRENLDYFIGKYETWSKYEPEEKESIVILCGSIYGHTRKAMEKLAFNLVSKGAENVKLYDASSTHVSDMISEIWRCGHIVIASSTYNGGIYTPIENLISDMKALNVQNRKVSIVENGTWAPSSGRLIAKELECLKGIEIVGDPFTIRSALLEEDEHRLEELAETIVASRG